MAQTNTSENLSAFIEAAKSKGASDEFMVSLLREGGWAAKDIYAAFARLYEGLTGLAVPERGAGAGEGARDAFLHLLAFSTLATWATALASLLFTFIDQWLPDTSYGGSRYEISNQMACIIVAFPVFLFVTRFTLRHLRNHPEKFESGVREWIIYIALLIAAGIVIGDLITFLAFFLRGELTVRLVLKVLTVLVIAGSIFWYYLDSLRGGSEDAEA
jgi:hypothetical protein